MVVIDKQIKKMKFFDKILIEFPNLKCDLDDAEVFEIHYKMERVAAYVNKCIKERNENEIILCFHIIEKYIKGKMNSKMENALNVSFCEPLYLLNEEEDRIWFNKLMKENLRKTYIEYKEYYIKTFESETN